MKKFKLITAIAAVTAIASNILAPVNAAKIIMNGTTENALGVTVLIADKTADVNNLKPNEIFWIDQQNVNSDGSFSIVLPAYDSSVYNMYTNSKNPVYGEAKSKTVYVSANGTGNGESADAPTTIDDAISNIDLIKEIILVDSVTLANANLPGDVTIKGANSTVVLTLAATVALSDSLKIDNLKLAGVTQIYANGFSFEVTDTVTSSSVEAERLTVYGGAYNKAVASTDLKLYGGTYKYIYGGGNGGKVTGDTNVIVGGNVNPGNTANDKGFCEAYGGGYNAAVDGKTNITLDGNAIVKYVVGAGRDGGTALDTNVFIKGGKAMNVYAGSRNVVLPTGVNAHVTITGGRVESIFGGCESVAMTGNTYVNLLGGEVTRRVYTGCYNNTEGYLSPTVTTDRYVTGTTTLTFAPGVSVNTNNGLSWDNKANTGVFAGSRLSSNRDAEKNTIIYLDDSYNTYNGKIGDKSGYSDTFKSFADYVVKALEGGKVYGTNTAGQIMLVPDSGKVAKIDSAEKAYFANDNATITGTHDVKFVDSITAGITATGVSGEANIRENENGKLVAAVYDSTGKFVACDNVDYVAETDSYDINIDCELVKGNTYTVKVFLWDSLDGMSPLMNVYTLSVQ